MSDIPLSQAQSAAAQQAWSAAAELLNAGAQGAGTVLLGELSRAVHSCRVAGLPRLSTAGLRVIQQLQDLHARRPEFRLAALTHDVQEMLATAHALRTSETSPSEWIGVARRPYSDVGALQLVGLFTEAVVSAAGYAGVVTYFTDTDLVIWSLGDVAPGGAERCRWAYITPIEFGGVTAEHRALSRGGLRLEHATAAANRRLGSGQRVVAELTEGTQWTEPPLSRLWDTPLEVQLDRAWNGREQARAGDDLLFVHGSAIGSHEEAVELRVGGRVLRAIAPSAHKELAYRRNLRALAVAPERELMLIGRIAFSQPMTLFLLGAAPFDAEHINLGLDALPATRIRRTAPASVLDRGRDVTDPLEPLTRRLRQVLLGGRATLSHAAMKAFDADEEHLTQSQMLTGAALLHELGAAPNGSELAYTWLKARTYLVAASARLQRLQWLS